MPNEWIEIEPVSGRDSGQIIIRYGKNDTSSGRSATIRIWNSDFKITATTVITQSICHPDIPTGTTDGCDVEVVYDVTSTTAPTKLYKLQYDGSGGIDYFTIDDNPTQYKGYNVYDEFTFDTTGNHTVHYHLTGENIANSQFIGNGNITDVKIGTGVKMVGHETFEGCENLSSITFSQGLETIGTSAFSGCSSLTDLILPEGLTNFGQYCFNYCTSLSSITIPSTIVNITSYAFRGCDSLSAITIPDSVTSLGRDCFNNCDSLSSITIGTGVTSIGEYCFFSCSSLTQIICLPTVPPASGAVMFAITNNCPIYVPYESVDAYKQAWSEYAERIYPINLEGNADIEVVYNVTSTTNPTRIYYSGNCIDYYTIDDDSTQHEPTSTGYTFDTVGSHTIHYYLTGDTTTGKMFWGCENIKDVVVSNNIRELGYEFLSSTSSVTSVTLGNSIEIIGYDSFNNNSFTSLTIPGSVVQIDRNCFCNTYDLEYVIFLSAIPPTIGSSIFLSSGIRRIYVPDDSVAAYRQALGGYSSRVYPLSQKPSENDIKGDTDIEWDTNISEQ